MPGRKLEVTIVGDSRSLERAFGRSASAGSKFGRGLRTLGKTAAVGVGAAFAGLAATLKIGFDEMAESQKVIAQTAATLKSTGGVANVTAKEIEGLATAQSKLTGIDDELIQAGENLLLTFKNVRNEVGEGNRIFDRATKSALDLSVAGFGSVESASKMMGKALNDPIKGMTALSRAGVTFSEDQKKAIKALVDTGHTLEAQKMILKEVESQVGGSAKAFGETFPGQLSKLKNSFEEMAGSIVQTLLPHLQSLVTWVNDHMPQIQAVIEGVMAGIEKAIKVIVPAIEKAIGIFQAIWDKAQAAWPAVASIIGLALDDVDEDLKVTRRGLGDFQTAHTGFWAKVQAAAEQARNWYRGELAPAISNVLKAIELAWKVFGDAIVAIVRMTIEKITAPLRRMMDLLGTIIRVGLALLRGDWLKAWDQLRDAVVEKLAGVVAGVKNKVTVVKNIFADAVNWLRDAGRDIIAGLWAGMAGAWSGLVNWAVSAAGGLVDAIKDKLMFWTSPPEEFGRKLTKRLVDGMIEGFRESAEKMKDAAQSSVLEVIDAAEAAIASKRGSLSAAFDSLASAALSAFDKLSSDIETKTEKKIRLQDERRAAGERQGALTGARAELETAVAGGDPAAIAEAQKAVNEALFQIQRAADEKRAAQERRQLEESRARKRMHLENELAALAAQAEKTGLSAEMLHKRVLGIFKKYEVPLANATAKLGEVLAAGLREAMKDATRAAKELAQAIVNQLGNIAVVVKVHVAHSQSGNKNLGDQQRQHGGPVSAGRGYIVGEKGPEFFIPGRSGQIIPNGGGRMAAAGGGGVTIVVNASNYVGDKRDLADAMQEVVGRFVRNNGGSFFPGS